MYDDDNDERYAVARRRLPGLLGRQQSVSRGAVIALCVVGAYALASEWRHAVQMAGLRAEKTQGFVVVVDRESGERLDVKPVAAAEWRLSDGMVKHRLTKIVSCLRGLDEKPELTRACWKETPLVFEGELAVNELNRYRAARFPSDAAFVAAVRREIIDVELIDAIQPDKNVPGRWWLRWKETHKPRTLGGKWSAEWWAGTFDVELVPVEVDPASTGLRVTRFEWHKDAKQGDG